MNDEPSRHDLNELAWGVIANAGGGDWTKEAPDWQDAATRWRDQYHKALAAPAPLDGLREALVDLVEFTEARVKDTCTPLSGCALANAKRLLALRDEGDTP